MKDNKGTTVLVLLCDGVLLGMWVENNKNIGALVFGLVGIFCGLLGMYLEDKHK